MKTLSRIHNDMMKFAPLAIVGLLASIGAGLVAVTLGVPVDVAVTMMYAVAAIAIGYCVVGLALCIITFGGQR